MIPTSSLPHAALLAALSCCISFHAAAPKSAAEDPKPGLVGEYFDIKDAPPQFDDVPAGAVTSLIRIDPQINFPNTQGDFNGSKLSDNFFVRWTGILRIPTAGSYNLWVESDDGSRLFLNDERVIDNWGLHGMTRKAVRRDLAAGDYKIRILYFEGTSDAGCIFGWDPPEGAPSSPIPAANLFHLPSLLSNAQNLKAFTENHASTPQASVDLDGEPRRFGYFLIEGDKIVIGESSGAKVPLDPSLISLVEFNQLPQTPPQANAPQPPQNQPLPAPWKHTAVGRLTSGASAHGDGKKIEVFTSSKHPEEPFSAFSMAYVPAPPVGHITARITRIDNHSKDTIAGVILRDGTSPDAGNVMLTIRPQGGAAMRSWKGQGGSSRTDKRSDIRPHYWVRIVRDGKSVTGLTSRDGRAWRKLWDIPEKFDSKDRLFGLVAASTEGDKPWVTTFEDVSVGTLEQAVANTIAEPRSFLSDGSIIHGRISSSEDGRLIRIGDPWNRTIPAPYLSRIDFFHPISDDVEKRLASQRPGVLLTSGDFIEASFDSLQPETLTVTSPLFGKRELRPGTEADSVIIREPAPSSTRRSPYKVETWDGQIFFARSFTAAGGKLILDSPYLGKPALEPDKIRRIARN